MIVRNPTPIDCLMAIALSLGLLVLCAMLDNREDDIMMQNLNSPAIEQGPITAADLEANQRAKGYRPDDYPLCHETMARLTARGAVAWLGVDPQALREGRPTPVDGGTELGAYYNDGAGWPQPAEACTDLGAEPQGQHRAGWITRAWLRLVRVLG